MLAIIEIKPIYPDRGKRMGLFTRNDHLYSNKTYDAFKNTGKWVNILINEGLPVKFPGLESVFWHLIVWNCQVLLVVKIKKLFAGLMRSCTMVCLDNKSILVLSISEISKCEGITPDNRTYDVNYGDRTNCTTLFYQTERKPLTKPPFFIWNWK